MRMLLLLIVGLLPVAAAAMTVTPRAAGGIFVAGKRLTFDLGDAKGTVTYTLTDYFGGEVVKGSLQGAEIDLPGVKPGWYLLTCVDEAGSVEVPIGVVIDRRGAALPEHGRVCADAASAWLIRKEAYRKPFARMIRLAGIPWLRERLSWPETEREPGKIDWRHYQAVADTLAAEGIRICQVFHQTPGWAASPAPDQMRPRDLRDLYRYIRTASSHFRKQIPAWEVWNEMDIDFWTGLADSFAAVQKTAYLGIKAGNPDALVLQSSLSHVAWDHRPDRSAWLQVDQLYDNGIGGYFDVFNWHAYKPPTEYPEIIKDYRALMAEHDYAPRQEWLTECGMAQQADPAVRILSADAQRAQCRFVPRSVVMGLASGTEKYFWFVVPDYMEGTNQFGLLRPDLLPYPGFVALSAAANILGLSDYIGCYTPQGSKQSAQVFKTPGGTVLAAWSDEPAEITIPTEKPSVQIADLFGAKSTVAAKDGAVTVKLGPEAVYVLDAGDAVMSQVRKAFPQRERRLPVNTPSGIVLVGRCDLPIDRHGHACYKLDPVRPFDYTVEVYCFDEQAGASGTVEVIAPTGWKVDQPKRTVKLDPTGREELRFSVTPTAGGGRISAWGKFGSPPAAPTVSVIE